MGDTYDGVLYVGSKGGVGVCKSHIFSSQFVFSFEIGNSPVACTFKVGNCVLQFVENCISGINGYGYFRDEFYYIAYAKKVGVSGVQGENHEFGVLPQHYADMFGWEEMEGEVTRIYLRGADKSY